MSPMRARIDESNGLDATYTYRFSFPLPADDGQAPAVVEAAFRLAARAHGLGIGDVSTRPDRVKVRVSVPTRMSPLEAAGMLRSRAEAWIGKTLPDSGTGADPLPEAEELLTLATVRM